MAGGGWWGPQPRTLCSVSVSPPTISPHSHKKTHKSSGGQDADTRTADTNPALWHVSFSTHASDGRYRVCQNQQRKLKTSIHQIFYPRLRKKEAVHYLGCVLVLFHVYLARASLASFYSMLISFLQYSVSYLHSTKNTLKNTKTYAANPDKKAIRVFCCSNSARGGHLVLWVGSISTRDDEVER